MENSEKPKIIRVTADPEQWSRSSKQSYGYDAVKYYEDISFNCWRCESPAVFTAEEQKHAFEIRKVYIWRRKLLCDDCWSKRQRIEDIINDSQAKWNTEKDKVRMDKAFLLQWLAALRSYPQYKGRSNHATIRMIEKLLKQCP